jgi:uncharacterized membrane protein
MWIFLVLRPTIGLFSENLEDKIFLPLLLIFIGLSTIGLILAYIDKELFHVVTDERTKTVDRSAIYYSWWFSILFAIIFGGFADINGFVVRQYVFVLCTVMFLSMLILHMFFNFKGQE